MRLLAIFLLTGCGRIGFGESRFDPSPMDDGRLVDGPLILADSSDPPRPATPISGLSPLPTGAVDLGVTDTPTGFTLTWTPVAGGDMFGVNLSVDLVPDADFRVTSTGNLYIGTTLTHTGASLMTTMSTNVGTAFIKRYVPDLSSYAEMDAPAGLATHPTYVRSADRWYLAVVGTSALHVQEMSDVGMPLGSPADVIAGIASPPISGTFAAGEGTLWSIYTRESGTCRFAIFEVPTLASSLGEFDNCKNPRADSAGPTADVVFETGPQLALMSIGESASSPVPLGLTGTRPRILRDPDVGLWIAFLDETNEIRLVRHAPEGPIVPAPLAGLPANITAFELVRRAGKSYLVVIANRTVHFVEL